MKEVKQTVKIKGTKRKREMTQHKLPWTKHEIIDAVIRSYTPFDVDDTTTWTFPGMLGVFSYLALGRPEGRATPAIEHQLWLRIRRIWDALQDGRDPNAAYETPREDEEELTTVDQWEGLTNPHSRWLKNHLTELDRELRVSRRDRKP
jgi:hypothetical protein